MSREELDQEALNLYSVVEVQNISGVPVGVAVDTLLLVNPQLSREECKMMVNEAESTGEGKLRPGDFCSVVQLALKEKNSLIEESIGSLRTLVYRMRLAFRRRFLMYDAPPNHAPPYLLENSTSTTMYRNIFDTASNGGDFISRNTFNELVEVILRDHRGLAASVMKAAVDTDDREGFIGFEEFVMVLQPATREIPLSMLLRRAETSSVGDHQISHRSLSETHKGRSESGPRPGAWLDNLHMRADESESRGRSQSTSMAATAHLKGELLNIRADDEAAAIKTHSIIQASKRQGVFPTQGMPFSTNQPSDVLNGGGSQLMNVEVRTQLQDVDTSLPLLDRVSQLEELLAKARLENKRLKQDITHWKLEATSKTESKTRTSLHSDANQKNHEDVDPRHLLSNLEAELRLCKAQLGFQNEAVELFNLLKRSSTSEAMRRMYTEESALVSKHEYLRKTGDVVDRNSPQAVLLSQYELLVCAYQSLYRSQREAGSARSASASGRSVSQTNSLAGRQRSTGRHRSPVPGSSRSQSTTAGRSPSNSVRRVAVSPFRWRDVDLPVSNELWKTGTLGDPVLTREERTVLRNKLAAQMRSAARTKSPRLKMKVTNQFDVVTREPTEVEPVASSQDTMLRLKRLSQLTSRAKSPFS